MKILFIGTNLYSGGAERVLSEIANGLYLLGHKIFVFTMEENNRIIYPLNKNITLFENHRRKRLNFLKAVFSIRNCVKTNNPDVIISFLHVNNILTILGLLGLKKKLFITEHSHPAYDILHFPWNVLRNILYMKATLLISVSNGVSDYFSFMSKSKKFVINNPLPHEIEKYSKKQFLEKSSVNSDRHYIVAMGRLHNSKGFDILISAFSLIAEENIEWDLIIIGEGSERKALEDLIKDLNLNNRVVLAGSIKNPFHYLRNSEIFVMSSLHEGFGNVIIEAMACGLPVVSFNCPCGPGEIITDNVDGILVETGNKFALAYTLKDLIKDTKKRRRIASAGIKRSKDFEISEIIKKWEKLLKAKV